MSAHLWPSHTCVHIHKAGVYIQILAIVIQSQGQKFHFLYKAFACILPVAEGGVWYCSVVVVHIVAILVPFQVVL